MSIRFPINRRRSTGRNPVVGLMEEQRFFRGEMNLMIGSSLASERVLTGSKPPRS